MLTSCAACPVGILTHIFVFNFNIYCVADFRRHVDCGEASLPLALGVEGADTDQPVHALFALQITVGHGTTHQDGGLRNAGFLVVLSIDQFNVIVVFAGPGDVHLQ